MKDAPMSVVYTSASSTAPPSKAPENSLDSSGVQDPSSPSINGFYIASTTSLAQQLDAIAAEQTIADHRDGMDLPSADSSTVNIFTDEPDEDNYAAAATAVPRSFGPTKDNNGSIKVDLMSRHAPPLATTTTTTVPVEFVPNDPINNGGSRHEDSPTEMTTNHDSDNDEFLL